MQTVRAGVLTGLLAQAALLAILSVVAGLTGVGVLAGLGYAAAVALLLARGLRRDGRTALGPADRITLARAVLVGAVAALVAESLLRPVDPTLLAALAAAALALDAVDGRVARRTGTVSAVGARFDVEVDSFLVFVLAVFVAEGLGVWVLLIGSVHYLLLVARSVLPWLRQVAAPRFWCKVVAAAQGILLVTVAADVLPEPIAVGALLVVATLLVESFGREVWELWCSRERAASGVATPALGPASG